MYVCLGSSKIGKLYSVCAKVKGLLDEGYVELLQLVIAVAARKGG